MIIAQFALAFCVAGAIIPAMGLSNWDLWVSAIGIVGVLVAIVLRFTFARKRRASDHPSCRKCGHDLFGLPETSTRCPECGTDLTAKRAILPHTRTIPIKRRWIVRAMILVALGLTVWAGWSVIHNPAYTQYKPSLVLVYIIERHTLDRHAPQELARRLDLDKLDRLSVWLIRQRAVPWAKAVADAPPGLGRFPGSYIHQLHAQGKIDDATFARMTDALVVVELGSYDEEGRPMAGGLELRARHLGWRPIPIGIAVRQCNVNGSPVRPTWKHVVTKTTSRWRSESGGVILPPGEHRVEVVVDVFSFVPPDLTDMIVLRTNHALSTTITIPDPATTQPASIP